MTSKEIAEYRDRLQNESIVQFGVTAVMRLLDALEESRALRSCLLRWAAFAHRADDIASKGNRVEGQLSPYWTGYGSAMNNAAAVMDGHPVEPPAAFTRIKPAEHYHDVIAERDQLKADNERLRHNCGSDGDVCEHCAMQTAMEMMKHDLGQLKSRNEKLERVVESAKDLLPLVAPRGHSALEKMYAALAALDEK